MFNVFIGLGSNLGNRTENCLAAIEHLSSFTIIKAVSSFYETEPVGNEDQPRFINAVAISFGKYGRINLFDDPAYTTSTHSP